MNPRKYLVGTVAAIMMILVPRPDMEYGNGLHFAYTVGICAALWFGMGWFWKRWQPDPAAEDLVNRGLCAATGVLLLGLAYGASNADTHGVCTQGIQTRDGPECVGDYVPEDGPDKGQVLMLLVAAGIAFWIAVKNAESNGMMPMCFWKGLLGQRKTTPAPPQQSFSEKADAFIALTEPLDVALAAIEPYNKLIAKRVDLPTQHEPDPDQLDAHYKALMAVTNAYLPVLKSVVKFDGPQAIKDHAKKILRTYTQGYELAIARYEQAIQMAKMASLLDSRKAAELEVEEIHLQARIRTEGETDHNRREAETLRRLIDITNQIASALDEHIDKGLSQVENFKGLVKTGFSLSDLPSA